jgi:hypothetical protein
MYLALFHGIQRVAIDCDREAPARQRFSLSSRPSPAALKRWLRSWAAVRHREAAERTVLTAIAIGAPDLLIAAETDRVFADGGHSLDFINKSFECLDLVDGNTPPICCPASSVKWLRPVAPMNRWNGASR